MTIRSLIMIYAVTLLVTVILLALQSAHAQSSFSRSCQNIQHHIGDDRLSAECRTMDGRWVHTELDNVGWCIGDIGNQDGQLVCNRRRDMIHREEHNWGEHYR